MNISAWKKLCYFCLLLPLLLSGCKGVFTSQNGKSVVITGRVVDKVSGLPIQNAVVRITKPPPEIDKVTDSTGVFTFDLKLDSTVTYTLQAQKEGYNVFSTSVLAVPNRDVELPDVELQSTDTTAGSSNAGGSGTSGYAASIVLTSVSSQTVVVKESGGNESSQLTFQVRDSSGHPVDLNHAATVKFKFGSAPGGGEALNPVQVKSNENGNAVTVLTSGKKAGVVQIVAQASVKGKTIRSKPVPISINAGLPDKSHFTLVPGLPGKPGPYNIPFPETGMKYPFTAYAGDKYGNVVTDGISIYFTSNGAYMEGSAVTGIDGSATVYLTDANPYPPNGKATITASTADENYNTITTSTKVLFSEGPILKISPTSISIPNGGSETFNYTIMDANGYPMAEGTQISVNVKGSNILATGDIGTTLSDVASDFNSTSINQLTKFSFTISDALPDSVVAASVSVIIISDGPNGYATKTITGTSQ